ncbi:hypothetical protein E2C01_085414 [Portunus trituberculatus]|uniref:Uncharacterized protein n=1 Tax=Portunus trituberculatus TaxID=210409 RepID=A0A5B7J8T6_PORTR|nr:hypothetical protein [Portunus trituberculatus]
MKRRGGVCRCVSFPLLCQGRRGCDDGHLCDPFIVPPMPPLSVRTRRSDSEEEEDVKSEKVEWKKMDEKKNGREERTV